MARFRRKVGDATIFVAPTSEIDPPNFSYYEKDGGLEFVYSLHFSFFLFFF